MFSNKDIDRGNNLWTVYFPFLIKRTNLQIKFTVTRLNNSKNV